MPETRRLDAQPFRAPEQVAVQPERLRADTVERRDRCADADAVELALLHGQREGQAAVARRCRRLP